MNTNRNIILFLLAILLIGLLYLVYKASEGLMDSRNNPVEVEENNSVTQDNGLKNNQYAQNDSLIVTNPEPGEVISSPLMIEGQVRGTWLFEANAPVVLTDWDGRIIGEGFITVAQDWMTENLIPFTAEIEFDEPEDIGDFSDKGTIILMKSNPSGLPQNDAALEFDIRFR